MQPSNSKVQAQQGSFQPENEEDEQLSDHSGDEDNFNEEMETNGNESGEDEEDPIGTILRSLVPRVELNEPDLKPDQKKELSTAIETLYQHCAATSGSQILVSPQNLLSANVSSDTIRQNLPLQQELQKYHAALSAIKTTIVRVDNRFKDLFCNTAELQNESKNVGLPILLIDTVSYCSHITQIKLIALPNNAKSFLEDSAQDAISFKLSNGQKHCFLIKNDKKAIDLTFQIRSLIPSKQVEANRVAQRFRCNEQTPLRAKEYWSKWEQELSNIAHYDFVNDPMVIEQFEQILKNSPKKVITIIDIGAGTGRLAYRLLDVAHENGFKVHYKLLDDNKDSLVAAKDLLSQAQKSYPDVFASVPEYLACDFSKPDKELDQRLKGTADVIICSGGPLSCLVGNYQPVKMGESKETKGEKFLDMKLLRLKTYEAENCTLIVTGRTSPLVTAKDLRATGHEVIRTSMQAYHSTGLRVFFPCLVAVNKQGTKSAVKTETQLLTLR